MTSHTATGYVMRHITFSKGLTIAIEEIESPLFFYNLVKPAILEEKEFAKNTEVNLLNAVTLFNLVKLHF